MNKLKKIDNKGVSLFYADVNKVKDIHQKYGINNVPVLLQFKNNNILVNKYSGCHESNYYKNIINQVQINTGKGTKASNQVIIYTTPTCTYCNTLKSYLKSNKISFREIDVSRDAKATQEMVRRSGQQGVPQSIINGQLVIGFDRNKINKLDLKN